MRPGSGSLPVGNAVLLILLAVLGYAGHARASDAITAEPGGAAYHYVSHYSVEIAASASAVWPHLLNMGAWMYEFEMSPVRGNPGEEGEVRRLYPGQDFMVQIVKVIPNRLLVIANLPSTFNEEYATGVGVITLHEVDGRTGVDLTMSRRYSWQGIGPNPQQQTRESADFREQTRAMWEDRFLGRLRSLAESSI